MIAEALAVANFGVGSVLCVFVILLWRNDNRTWGRRFREDREEAEKRLTESRLQSEAKFSHIASEFRAIVEENTKALTILETTIERGYCPYAKEFLDNVVRQEFRRPT